MEGEILSLVPLLCRPHVEGQNYLFNVGIDFIIDNSETEENSSYRKGG